MENRFALTKRDHGILIHLWRWKLISTHAIAERYFEGNLNSAYKRIHILKRKAGVVKIIPIRHEKRFAWTLTKKGFAHIQEFLPDLRVNAAAPHASWHDALASAIHQGDWYTQIPEGCDLFSERQLQCYHSELYPTWVPRAEKRRPDGYWLAQLGNGDQKVIAFELQLSAKSPKWWSDIHDFYRSQKTIDHVIWVIQDNTSIKRRALALNKNQNEYKKHIIFKLKDVVRFGWSAPSLNGNGYTESIESILVSNGVPTGFARNLPRLLNFRKKPIITEPLPNWSPP